MMMIPKWGNYPGDGGGGITLVIDKSPGSARSSPGCGAAFYPGFWILKFLDFSFPQVQPLLLSVNLLLVFYMGSAHETEKIAR